MAEIDMRRITRRELKSSRAISSVVVAVVVILGSLYALLECTLKLLDQPAWLIDPQQALLRLAQLPSGVPVQLLGVVGVILILVGVVFLVKAIGPGVRARHALTQERLSVVADDEVIASALARRARTAAAVSAEQVRVTVGQKTVLVTIRPTSGAPVAHSAVHAAVDEELSRFQLVRQPRVRVTIASEGAVGV